MKVAGIYQIRNIVNGKVYIGSAVNIERRWGMHKNRLKAGQHRNIHLQRAGQVWCRRFRVRGA